MNSKFDSVVRNYSKGYDEEYKNSDMVRKKEIREKVFNSIRKDASVVAKDFKELEASITRYFNSVMHQ